MAMLRSTARYDREDRHCHRRYLILMQKCAHLILLLSLWFSNIFMHSYTLDGNFHGDKLNNT